MRLISWGTQLSCMKSSLAETSCSTSDEACLCLDTKYTEALENCVLVSCTIRESLGKHHKKHIFEIMLT